MKIPELIKQRSTYVERVSPFIRKSLVKVLVGHRRVGKNYILY
jgi:predicted AAA+ superfamily ATPase